MLPLIICIREFYCTLLYSHQHLVSSDILLLCILLGVTCFIIVALICIYEWNSTFSCIYWTWILCVWYATSILCTFLKEFIVYLTNTLEIGVLMVSESFNNVTKDPDDFCLSSLWYFSMFTLCLYMWFHNCKVNAKVLHSKAGSRGSNQRPSPCQALKACPEHKILPSSSLSGFSSHLNIPGATLSSRRMGRRHGLVGVENGGAMIGSDTSHEPSQSWLLCYLAQALILLGRRGRFSPTNSI